jgi:hypothetical protein
MVAKLIKQGVGSSRNPLVKRLQHMATVCPKETNNCIRLDAIEQ